MHDARKPLSKDQRSLHGEDPAMEIKLVCPNGHKLRAKAQMAGKTAVCPACQARLTIPRPRAAHAVSDTSVMALLGGVQADRSMVIPPAKMTAKAEPDQRAAPASTETDAASPLAQLLRACPKCRTMISRKVRICPSCRLYLPDLPEHGQKPARTCHLCGEVAGPGDTQCVKCGADVPLG